MRTPSEAGTLPTLVPADLIQETWLVAHRARPRTLATARAWLRHVLVSRLRDVGRARQRRASREQAVVRPVADAEDPEALAAQMELHRRVAETMATLDDPIRQADEIPGARVAPQDLRGFRLRTNRSPRSGARQE